MTEREKVIAAYVCSNEKLPDKRCEKCPYGYEYLDQTGDNYFVGCNTERIMVDAIDLLRAQEPRVMTLIEWIRASEPADGECMCYEIKDNGLQAMLVKAFDGARHLYGKAFRCWTSRPTDEQREATKWE